MNAQHGALPLLAHLTDGRSSLLITSNGGMPCLAHWGAPLGAVDALLLGALERPVPNGGLDVDPPVGLVAEASVGWFGTPGLEGHRADGRDFAPQFTLTSSDIDASKATFVLADQSAGLSMTIAVVLHPSGVAVFTATVTNDSDADYSLDALRITLPVPAQAQELLTIGGRWTNEFGQTRTPWTGNCVTIENRRGKTSHERLGVVFAGTPAFAEQRGEVWGCHIGWSGNFGIVCDSVTDGRRCLQIGELLASGEITLSPGQHYDMPAVYACYSATGLNAISNSFHTYLRSRPQHPSTPRPVLLNIWEAVYFDHDLDTLRALADVAAACGVERFVVDDGWFHSRRNDQAGLGDWWVDTGVWPQGLDAVGRARPWPRNAVRDLGRTGDGQPGLGSVPRSSRLDVGRRPLPGRARPKPAGARPRPSRGRATTSSAISTHCCAITTSRYVKWDMNRDLVAATSHGRAGVHRQTLGVYGLLDRLRAAHPGVEFETCASGGGRVDFGIFERTERAWTSDSIDALDRQADPARLLAAVPAGTDGHTHRLTGCRTPRDARTVSASARSLRCSARSASSGTCCGVG